MPRAPKLVIVDWWDHCVYAGWERRDRVDGELVLNRTVGWIVFDGKNSEGRETIVVAGTIVVPGRNGADSISCAQTIEKAAIKKIRRLKGSE